MSELAPDDQSVKIDEQQGGDVDASGTGGDSSGAEQTFSDCLHGTTVREAAGGFVIDRTLFVNMNIAGWEDLG